MLNHYNREETWMYAKTYYFIKGFAVGLNLPLTLKALPLARAVHNGQYRKGTVKFDEKEYRLPYLAHVLKVCSTLISIFPDTSVFSREELDVLLSSSLLHDCKEDAPEGFFPGGFHDIVSVYEFPERVYQTVCLLSKRSGATEGELDEYFDEIKKNKLALLIKLSDRSHNVETLHSMKPEKLRKYVEETRRWIYPLSSYAKSNYPELSGGITILKSKIVSLTEETEVLVEMFEERLAEKDETIARLMEVTEKPCEEATK